MWWPVCQIERAWVWLRYWETYADKDEQMGQIFCKGLRDSMVVMNYNYSFHLVDSGIEGEDFDISKCFVKVENYGCRKKDTKWGIGD